MKSKDAVAVVAAASAATAAFLLYRRRRSRRPPFVPLRRSELPTHPYDLAQRWIDEHQRATNFLEAHCVCLATSSPSGGATARTVLLQKLDQNVGLIFGSQASSLKGSDAAADVRAEAVLRLGERQVRFRGTLRLGDAGQSDDAFHRVPRGAQLGLTLLRQGTPCNDDEYAAIEQRWLALAAADDGEAPVARPADFSAFILEPATVEFYQGGHPGFCNDRFLYKQIGLAGFVLEGRLMA